MGNEKMEQDKKQRPVRKSLLRGQHPSAEAIKQLTTQPDSTDSVEQLTNDSLTPSGENLDLTIEGQQMKLPVKNVPRVVEKTPMEIFQAIPFCDEQRKTRFGNEKGKFLEPSLNTNLRSTQVN